MIFVKMVERSNFVQIKKKKFWGVSEIWGGYYYCHGRTGEKYRKNGNLCMCTYVYIFIRVYNIYVHYILYMCKICIYHASTVDIYNIEMYSTVHIYGTVCVYVYKCLYVYMYVFILHVCMYYTVLIHICAI